MTAIVEDRAGRIWIATYGGGLDRFDRETERFTHYRNDPQDPSSLSGNRVSSIAESPTGHLWVGTMEKGVNLLDPSSGRFQRFMHRPGDATSLPSGLIHAVMVDGEGGLWVGTHGGLSHRRRDSTAFETFTTRNGLPNNVVYSVLPDGRERLWLSTNNGLSRFEPHTGEFTNYGVSDGLQGTEFNFGAWYRTSKGELLFGGNNGFNAFDPSRLSARQTAPPVVLTSVNVGYRPLSGPADQVHEVRLGFRDKVLGFEFAALDFTAPGRNRFAYRLDGFDPDWVPLAGRPSVTYTNLNPGRYTFRLRAVNGSGGAYERPSAGGAAAAEELALPITVVPPPWRTAWAYSLYAVAVAAAVAFVVGAQRRKDRRAAAYRKQLEDEVHKRVREIGVLTELREKERLVDFLRGFTSELTLRSPTGIHAATTHDVGSDHSPAVPELDRSPALAGRFEILDVVGHGGMGVVYRARDRKLDETVALKVLRSDILKEDDVAIERFKREIKLARRVTHRNVLRTFEFDDAGGSPFLSMEFVDGVTLKQLITSLGPLPLVPGMCVARQACQGLGAAHAQGVVHRDVKPQNMLVVPGTGELKIADFGISRACEIALGMSGITRSGTIIGTPEYIAPEQAQGRGPDFRSDVYALGVVLFEVFTGRLPFTGDTPLATILNHVDEAPPRPTAINPSIPAGLEEAILRCLEKDPERRFADANDLLKTLTSTVAPVELSALAAEGWIAGGQDAGGRMRVPVRWGGSRRASAAFWIRSGPRPPRLARRAIRRAADKTFDQEDRQTRARWRNAPSPGTVIGLHVTVGTVSWPRLGH